MSRIAAYRCGTPKDHCTGSVVQGESVKVHSTNDQAFRCYVHYKVKVLGYTMIGARELSPPPDADGNLGPVEVLTKKIRFGGRFKRGKENRLMRDRNGGVVF